MSVVLVVLLALLGTALLVSARNDHQSARQGTFNTQVDLLVEGVCRMVKGRLVDDLFGGPDDPLHPAHRPFRPAEDPTGVYQDVDSPATDLWMASRVPEVPDDTKPPRAARPEDTGLVQPAGPLNPPAWRAVSWPLLDATGAGGSGGQFVSPAGDAPLRLDPARRGDYLFAPTVAEFNGQHAWPQLKAYLSGEPVALLPAADADGDGIADAGLWPLTNGPLEGLTWYAAVRIVDNNSAINVNTALSRDFDFDGLGRAVKDARTFSPARVGLAELLRTYNPGMTAFAGLNGPGAEMDRLNAVRFGGAFLPAGVYVPGLASGGDTAPVGDDGQRRDDFRYSGVADALWSQLGRRLDNPGRTDANALARPFAASEAGVLAHHGGLLRNPLVQPPSPLEQVLAESLSWEGSRWPVPSDRYRPTAPEDVLAWFDQYNYAAETPGVSSTNRSLRPLLVTRNPVTNIAPPRYSERDTNEDGLRNDVPSKQMAPYGARFEADPVVARSNINTASFWELWRAFWCVMCDEQKPDHAPIGENNEVLAAGIYDPFYGNRGYPREYDVHPALMFRSSIRDMRQDLGPGRVVRFQPGQQMLLRAALAAVNAEDLRDGDDDVTSHLVVLKVDRDGLRQGTPADPEGVPTAVVVYGTERQPYITEVFVSFDQEARNGGENNPKGYIAIELFNPYDEPILLSPPAGAGGPQDGWSIGMIDRSRDVPAGSTGIVNKPSIQVRNLDGSTGAPAYRFPAGTFIPAQGYLVLENYDANATGAGGDPYRARFRPPAAIPPRPDGSPVLPPVGGVPPGMENARVLYVPNLHKLIGDPRGEDGARAASEFVLLRTRRADCISQAGAEVDPAGGTFTWDERNNLNDLVPVDQHDLTGLSLRATDNDDTPVAFHYPRPSGPGAEWKFVWPGYYAAEPHVALPGQPPVAPSRWNPSLGQMVGGVGLGRGGGGGSSLGFQIQLANTGFGGPNKPGQTGPPYRHPFGGFARNGDILQVPFIGAYAVYDPVPPPAGEPVRLLEMNAVTMDTMFAHDTDRNDDVYPREQVGRFVPVNGVVSGIFDNNPNGSYLPVARQSSFPISWGPVWRYRWAMDLFNYVTVQSPASDYWPEVSPEGYAAAPGHPPPPVPVSNGGGAPNGPGEVIEPVEGLININTAPAKVLSALPLVFHPDDYVPDGSFLSYTNESMARLVARFRDFDGVPETREGRGRAVFAGAPASRVVPYGAFRSVYDLNAVYARPSASTDWGPATIGRTGGGDFVWGDLIGYAHTPDAEDPYGIDAGASRGDFSPEPTAAHPRGGDGVRDDFEEYFLAANRISNLVTTRSDSFTCYVVVQGWRDAGTPQARLVVQRRVAFLADRSAVTPKNREVRTQVVPND